MDYSLIGIVIFIAYVIFLIWSYRKEHSDKSKKNSFPITDDSSFNKSDLEALGDLLLVCQVQAFASYDSAKINKDTEAKKDLVLLFDAVAHGYIYSCLNNLPDKEFIKTNTAFEYYWTAMDEHGVGDYGGAGGFEERKDYLIEKGESPAVFDAIEYGSTKRVNKIIEVIEKISDEHQPPAFGKYLTFDQYIDAFTKEKGNLIPYKLDKK